MRDPWRPSPARRLAVAGVAVSAAVLVAGGLLARALPGGDGDASGSARAAASSVPAAAEPPLPGGARDDAGPGQVEGPAGGSAEVDQAQVDASTAEVRDVATTSVAAWQLPDSAARAAALTPLATPAFAAAAATIDPTRVPQAPVASASTVLDADGLARVRVTLTDGTVLLVDLELGADWLVAGILPEA